MIASALKAARTFALGLAVIPMLVAAACSSTSTAPGQTGNDASAMSTDSMAMGDRGTLDASMAEMSDVFAQPDSSADPTRGFFVRDGTCRLWMSSPPEMNYLRPARNEEGLWLASSERKMIFNRSSTGWQVSHFEKATVGSQARLLAATGAVALLADATGAGLLRQNGQWHPLPSVGAPMVNAWATVNDLFVTTSSGVYVLDAGQWVRLFSVNPGAMAWGTRNVLYYVLLGRLVRFDGAMSTTLPATDSDVIDIAATKSERVYAMTQRSVYAVTGNSLEVVPLDPQCESGISATLTQIEAGGDVVAVQASCGATAKIFKLTGATWSSLAAFPSFGDIVVDNEGELYIDSRQQLFRWTGVSWEPMGGSDGPPYTRLTGTSIDNLYAVGPRLARFTGDAWEAVPSPLNDRPVYDAWASAEGDVFVVSDGRLWRRSSRTDWVQDHVLSPPEAGNSLLGRSNADVFAFLTGSVLHWDGRTWGSIENPCTGTIMAPMILSYGLIGRTQALVHCREGGSKLWNGSTWTNTTYPNLASPWGYGSDPAVGPTSAPSVLFFQGSSLVALSESGPVPVAIPAGSTPDKQVVITGPSVERLVGIGDAIYRSDRGAPWQVTSPSFFTSIYPPVRAYRVWSDGRYAAWINSAPVGVAICDLGG